MPKYREDLLVVAFRIAEAIAANNWAVDPPKVRVDFVPIFSHEGLEVRRAFRIRIPFRTEGLRKKKGARKNQITIPASYLYLRWVDLNRTSPLWYLTARDSEERRAKGVFYDQKDQKWKILCYQVVEDMNHVRRMFVHIFANYERERSRNEATQRGIERQVVESSVFGPGLSPAAKAEAEGFKSWLDRRWEDMGSIKGPIGRRADFVHYYAARNEALLRGISHTLLADADNLEKGGRFNLANFVIHLRQEQAKLDQFVSKNIRMSCRKARRRIDKAIRALEIDRTSASVYLRVAALFLQDAVDELKKWGSSITKEEIEEAARYRGF
jgi:hypothetical protein